MPIRILDPNVAAQIAAGEVVERPASVIKELVENALDAGARRISVEIRGGGVTELRIQDDGSGIPPDEVELAFQRHATSKLLTAEDLFAIGTLGFRGEALPSIASIAQVICTTRVASEPTGVELRIAGGEIQSRTMVGAPVGTTFVIRNLFYNIPVRRDFLRSPGAEAAAISAILTQYALAYPHIRFSLIADGKSRLQTNGSGLLSDVILSVYGLDVARAMLPLDYRDGGDLTGVGAKGLVSPPTMSRGSRDAMHLSVNGRAIAARGQAAGILDDAYHTLLMKGRFPYVVLAIQVHPAAVDVNVHPTKSEVKFRDPERVRAVLSRAIRNVVQASVVVQGWEGGSIIPPPGSIPAWADEEEPEQLELIRETPAAPLEYAAPPAPPAGMEPDQSDAARSADEAETRAEGMEKREPAPPEGRSRAEQQQSAPAYQAHVPAIDAQLSRQADHAAAELPAPQMPSLPEIPARSPRPEPITPRIPATSPMPSAEPRPAPDRPAAGSLAPQMATSSSAPQQPTNPPQASPGVGLPRLRTLAQLARMYLLAEGPDGDLYLIDQHAAHERITYERLMEQRGRGAIESQRMLIPQIVIVPPSTQATLMSASAELTAWGFELEEAEQGVRVRAVPASVAADEVKAALLEVADHLSGAGGSTPADWREAMLVTLSCHTSVRTGQPLTAAEQQALVDQLARCQGPRTCPHGRPTVIVMTKQQLTRQFGRVQ